jgi:CheY-like chemotaxis protein
MNNKRILVVDDDQSVIESLRVKIGARYDVISTTAPKEVMRLAREQEPQLILCDLDMPEMNGGDISAALFVDEELRHIPLLFLTGAISPQDLKALEGRIGGRPAFPKSLPVGELVERIDAILEA